MRIKFALRAIRWLYRRYRREQFRARATASSMWSEGYTELEIAIATADTPIRYPKT